MATEKIIQPLLLNLLAEEQLAEIKKARDPLKMALAIALGVLLLTVGAGSVLGLRAEQKRIEMTALQQQLSKLTAAATTDTLEALKSDQAFCADVVGMNRHRSLVAPQLAFIKDITPDAVQLTRVSLTIVSEVVIPPEPPPGAEKKIRRSAMSATVDKLTLMIEGLATGSRPEIEVDDFLKTLRADPQLKDKVTQIELRSISPNTAAGSSGTASFVIECRFKELAK
jgi:hypothetical protein